MRQLLFRATALSADRLRQRARQQFPGSLTVRICTQIYLSRTYLRVLELDCRCNQGVVKHLGAANLSSRGAAENMRGRVELANRLHKLGIPQRNCSAKHEDELCGLSQNSGGTWGPTMGLHPCSLLGFHECSARSPCVIAAVGEKCRTVYC